MNLQREVIGKKRMFDDLMYYIISSGGGGRLRVSLIMVEMYGL